MPTSPEQILQWLTRLRAVHDTLARRSPEFIKSQNTIYVDALRDFDPRWLSGAVNWWVNEGDRFPKPKDLRDKAREFQTAAADRGKLEQQAIPNGVDPGSTARDEAILLLGDVDKEARRRFGQDDAVKGSQTPEYRRFLGEAAIIWSRQRPADVIEPPVFRSGYEVAMKQKKLPRIAADLQAWGRQWLADHPPASIEPALAA